MGIKIAKALGATVTAISTSPQKEADAKAMGASNFLLSTDAEAMGKARDSLSLSLSLFSVSVSPYMRPSPTSSSPRTLRLVARHFFFFWHATLSFSLLSPSLSRLI